MRYLLFILLLLMPTLAFAEHGLPDALDEANEFAIWTMILSTGGWAFRTWWKSRLESKHKVRVEKRLEDEWTNGDATLSGSKNPGRTLPQLVELVHDDLKEFKRETNRDLRTITDDVGRIKGKLDMQ